ncbi:unnamed protein product [Allacma fusca]|uniref:Uncharacterized protein n=1 Tax=Allacma fusca TaxID=39272 RepID=A0A8J2LME8_9HEXA|nr:unnamed protein product [Allacma fusca]
MMMMFIPGATLLIQKRKYRTGKITKIHSNDLASYLFNLCPSEHIELLRSLLQVPAVLFVLNPCPIKSNQFHSELLYSHPKTGAISNNCHT